MLTKIFTATVLSVGVGMTASASTQTTTIHKNHCSLNLKSSQASLVCHQTNTRPDCCQTKLACCEHALQQQAAQNRWLESLETTRLTGNAFHIERPTANSPPC
ncbi:hypothetical protein [Gimesia panareensis]|uniref:hypothetical protein n=1 Tax=Gimesia panareensis TaxID=2527978 RepID=UPI001187AACB|nr:hypothetical protein [Gimesia panareensis]QDU49363.1 hypothetical protein Pan110_16830 [Gimesia panareensis]